MTYHSPPNLKISQKTNKNSRYTQIIKLQIQKESISDKTITILQCSKIQCNKVMYNNNNNTLHGSKVYNAKHN